MHISDAVAAVTSFGIVIDWNGFFYYSVVEWLAPEHGLLGYGRMAILKKAASGVSTMETCKKYRCNPPPSVQYN